MIFVSDIEVGELFLKKTFESVNGFQMSFFS